MFQFVIQHQFLFAVVLSWIYSAAVSSMPDPAASSNPGYTCLYRFLHTIAGNLSTAFSEAARYRACASRSGKMPGLKSLVLILAIPLVLVTPACAVRYTLHPGALSPADSAAYDTLLIAKTTIDQGRLDSQSGRLPAEAKPALDALVESYNIARDSWLIYRGAVSTNTPADVYLTRLNQNLTDLASNIRRLREPANASAIARSHQEKEAK